MDSLKFSLIVRIYNAEKYLERQIKSVIAQTYSNWELILINDGSTDGSGKICDKYVLNDNRIKTIHQKNSGCTCATVVGIQNSSGDYCLAIDADDYLDNNLLEVANRYLSNSDYDILEYGIRYIRNGEVTSEFHLVEEEKDFTQDEFLNFTWKTTTHSLCLKFIRRCSLKFKVEEIRYFTKNKINQNEDMLLAIPYITSSKRIKVIPDCLYNYELFEDSVSHGIEQTKKIKLAFDTCNTAMTLMKSHGICLQTVKKLVTNELYREIFPLLPRVILFRLLDRETITELKSYAIYKETKLFVVRHGALSFFAWIIFRLL